MTCLAGSLTALLFILHKTCNLQSTWPWSILPQYRNSTTRAVTDGKSNKAAIFYAVGHVTKNVLGMPSNNSLVAAVFTIKGFGPKMKDNKISDSFNILDTVLLAKVKEHMPWGILLVFGDDELWVDCSNLD
jgi:hypothetical protein